MLSKRTSYAVLTNAQSAPTKRSYSDKSVRKVENLLNYEALNIERKKIAQWLLRELLHAYQCRLNKQLCPIKRCQTLKNVLKHISLCASGIECTMQNCTASKVVISHWNLCNQLHCTICYSSREKYPILNNCLGADIPVQPVLGPCTNHDVAQLLSRTKVLFNTETRKISSIPRPLISRVPIKLPSINTSKYHPFGAKVSTSSILKIIQKSHACTATRVDCSSSSAMVSKWLHARALEIFLKPDENSVVNGTNQSYIASSNSSRLTLARPLNNLLNLITSSLTSPPSSIPPSKMQKSATETRVMDVDILDDGENDVHSSGSTGVDSRCNKDWHRTLTNVEKTSLINQLKESMLNFGELRNNLNGSILMEDEVKREVDLYCRRMENDCFRTAISKEEYFHLCSILCYTIHTELEERKRRVEKTIKRWAMRNLQNASSKCNRRSSSGSVSTPLFTNSSVTNLDDQNYCVVCFEKAATMVLYKCGHVCLCNDCVVKIQKEDKLCPICRVVFVDAIKVYGS